MPSPRPKVIAPPSEPTLPIPTAETTTDMPTHDTIFDEPRYPIEDDDFGDDPEVEVVGWGSRLWSGVKRRLGGG